MTRAIDVVLALGAEEETVQALILSHGVNAIEPASEHLMHVALMADIEDELVVRGGEDACSAMVNSTTPRFGPRWPPVAKAP
jgi:hypothetical protein